MPLANGQRRLTRLTGKTPDACQHCQMNGQGVLPSSPATRAVVNALHYTGRVSPLPLCRSHAAMLVGEPLVAWTLTTTTKRGTP